MQKLLLAHADIHTMNPAQPRAQAAVIEGDRFAFVGTQEGALAYLAAAKYERIDAEGCTVVPGFVDSHLHLLGYALSKRRLRLSDARCLDDALRALREAPGMGWLRASGFNHEHWPERRLPTLAELDAACPHRPLVAVRACGHIGVVNSAALRLLGPDAPQDGVLREEHLGLVNAHIPAPDLDTALAALREAEPELFAQGITSVHSDDLGGLAPESAGDFFRALAGGHLRLRYAAQARLGGLDSLRAFFANGYHRLRGERFHVNAIKLMGDGSLGARTAWLSRPYADAPDQRGIECTDAATMRAMVAEAARNGLPCAVHAIGDAAAETVLDAFALEGRGLRQAIVHAQIMLPEQVVRCGQMGLVILAQPIFLKADAPIVRARVGSLADSSYRWKQMLGGGAHVAFGTDCPVEPFDPMAGLYCAMSRRSTPQSEAYLPEEGFTLDEAVYAYTAAGAYAEGEEARKGRIQSGMAADFVVLSRRLCDEAPEALLETTVAKTYLAGQCVHGA